MLTLKLTTSSSRVQNIVPENSAQQHTVFTPSEKYLGNDFGFHGLFFDVTPSWENDSATCSGSTGETLGDRILVSTQMKNGCNNGRSSNWSVPNSFIENCRVVTFGSSGANC